MNNVVAFSREGDRDIIMFEHSDRFEVQSRLSLVPQVSVPFSKENENAYDQAERVFDALDEALCGEAD